jgi:hypothetical protein
LCKTMMLTQRATARVAVALWYSCAASSDIFQRQSRQKY